MKHSLRRLGLELEKIILFSIFENNIVAMFPNKKIYLEKFRVYLEKVLTCFEKYDKIFVQ